MPEKTALDSLLQLRELTESHHTKNHLNTKGILDCSGCPSFFFNLFGAGEFGDFHIYLPGSAEVKRPIVDILYSDTLSKQTVGGSAARQTFS